MLKFEWAYPVWKPMVREESGETQGAEARQALSKEDAWKWVAGDDPRPLLVLREFDRIDHPSNPVLSRKLFSEKSTLMSHWFNCVRLPHSVSEPDHPFHNLFDAEQEGHLFIATADGKNRLDISVKESQSRMFKSMERILAESYEGDIDNVLRKLPKLMGQLDRYEVELRNLKDMVDSEIERKGPKDARVQRLRAQVEATETKVEELKAEKDELMDLKLRKEKEAAEKKAAEKEAVGG